MEPRLVYLFVWLIGLLSWKKVAQGDRDLSHIPVCDKDVTKLSRNLDTIWTNWTNLSLVLKGSSLRRSIGFFGID